MSTCNNRFGLYRLTPPPLQSQGDNVEIATKILKLQLGQRFGESISELIMSGNKANIRAPLHELISNEVVVNFNVLHATMKRRIRGEVLGAHVVTPHKHALPGEDICSSRRRA
jgi:hypothetical protein